MHIYVIEKPLACKVKMVRMVRGSGPGKRKESLPYRFRKTAQQQRRSRLRWYRLTHGKPYLWPPINMHLHYEPMWCQELDGMAVTSDEQYAREHEYEGSERWSPDAGDEVFRNGQWEKK